MELAAEPSASSSGPLAGEHAQFELLQLLYLCPVAIVRIDQTGKILLMNPFAAQLLMPISPDGMLNNLFELLDPFAPEVAEMALRFEGRAGIVCAEHRIALPQRTAGGMRTILSITLKKIDTDVAVGVISDVTASAARELFVRLSEERLHAVLDGVKQYSICTVDTAGKITSWNRAAERLDDYRSDETMGRHIDMLVSFGGGKSPMKRRLELARQNGSHQFESWRVRKDGRKYWASISISALYDKDGTSPLGYSVVAQDLTEQRRSEDRLRVLATTDPLTGALNRRAFFERARHERTRTLDLESVAVLLIDADHFKLINDEHGHDMGDTVLQRIVEVARKEIRSLDLLGRFGGEEFAVFLPGCDANTAQDVAERIRTSVAGSAGLDQVGCTVSIGVAVSRSASESVEELIRRADAAMYAAKTSGRNRVVAG